MTRWQDAHGPTWNGLRELHLFAGAGGGILGGLLLGHVPVCAVEIDPYCQEVLHARQRDGMLPDFPIHDDIRTFDGWPWAGRVDVVAGGFPCQDISVAGKGAGIDGERSGLWREMARVVSEVRPRFVFVENSPALVGRGLTRVLGDLASLGYDARWTVLGARHVGAPHKRDRIWILANASSHGMEKQRLPEEGSQLVADAQRCGGDGKDSDMADYDSLRWDGRAGQFGTGGRAESADSGSVFHAEGDGRGQGRPRRLAEPDTGLRQPAPCAVPITSGQGLAQREGAHGERALATTARSRRWPAEPRLGRVAHGVANRVDRIRAIGNGQVPRVAAAAWRELMSWEVPA